MEAVSHTQILDALQELIETVGGERHDPETGRLKYTGIFARFREVEDSIKETRESIDVVKRERDRWKRDIAVATAVIVAVFGFIAWLEADRIDHVRKVITTPVAEAKT